MWIFGTPSGGVAAISPHHVAAVTASPNLPREAEIHLTNGSCIGVVVEGCSCPDKDDCENPASCAVVAVENALENDAHDLLENSCALTPLALVLMHGIGDLNDLLRTVVNVNRMTGEDQ